MLLPVPLLLTGPPYLSFDWSKGSFGWSKGSFPWERGFMFGFVLEVSGVVCCCVPN